MNTSTLSYRGEFPFHGKRKYMIADVCAELQALPQWVNVVCLLRIEKQKRYGGPDTILFAVATISFFVCQNRTNGCCLTHKSAKKERYASILPKRAVPRRISTLHWRKSAAWMPSHSGRLFAKWQIGSYHHRFDAIVGTHTSLKADLLTILKVVGHAKLRKKGRNIKRHDRDRYFTWTGNHLRGIPTTRDEHQDELIDLYQEIFPEEAEHKGEAMSHSGVTLTLDDAFLLERATRARGGNGLKYSRLWAGAVSCYTKRDGSPDQSPADQALLAYWTQKDAVHREWLFLRSGLYRQDRWKTATRSGETNGQGSIRLANCHRVYDPTWAEIHKGNPQLSVTPECLEVDQHVLRKRVFPQNSGTEQMEPGRTAI